MGDSNVTGNTIKAMRGFAVMESQARPTGCVVPANNNDQPGAKQPEVGHQL